MAGCYLAFLMDLPTKKIVGYLFSRSMTTELIIKALENTYYTQEPNKGLIFHSDLGSRYTSDDFAEIIKECKMKHSFSYKGSLYDNACIESFYTILKNYVQYYDFHSAKIALFKYIESWYNQP